jgi:hypothetical protein
MFSRSIIYVPGYLFTIRKYFCQKPYYSPWLGSHFSNLAIIDLYLMTWLLFYSAGYAKFFPEIMSSQESLKTATNTNTITTSRLKKLNISD